MVAKRQLKKRTEGHHQEWSPRFNCKLLRADNLASRGTMVAKLKLDGRLPPGVEPLA